MQYGATFDVTTPDAAQIAHVSLIRSPSVTHAIDMNQRFQFLNFTQGAGKVTVTAPANANLAPPGRLHALHRRHERRAVGGQVRARAGPGRHDPADRGDDSAGSRCDGLEHGLRHRDRKRQRRGRRRAVQARRREPRRRGHARPRTASPWDTQTAINGSHSLTAVARDLTGNTTTSTAVNVTVSNTGPVLGLVGAYGFDEASGTTALDQSGQTNNGTISGATWTASGKYGGALTFDGSSNLVTVPDAASLDLTTGMTAEAWVQPTALGNTWRTVAFKETGNYYSYALYASTGSGVPSGNGLVGTTDADVRAASSIPIGSWTHLATTYDGNMLRIFVNGVQSAQLLQVGSLTTSTGALRIGGNNIWPEWFQGQIDEVRIYNRALTAVADPGGHGREHQQPGRRAAVGSGRASLQPARSARSPSAGPPRRTTSASPATTCTAARPRASRRRPRTGSRSRRARRTPTPASRPAPTTTRSPPRTPPATWDRRPPRRSASPPVTSRRRPHRAR